MTTIEYVSGHPNHQSRTHCNKCNRKFKVGDVIVGKKAGRKMKTKAFHKSCWEKMHY